MNRKKIKLLGLGVLSTIFISSTSVSAASNPSSASKTPSNTIPVSERVQGANSKHVVSKGFIKYTYKNAPTDVKTKYEADCKSVNKTPSESDTIMVPVKDAATMSTNSVTAASIIVTFNVYYTSTTGALNIYGSDGSYYYANTNTDYVGYGHITSGSPVYCLQVVLNMLGYGLAVDGQFGTNTHNAVCNYQNNHFPTTDGIVGPVTWVSILKSANLA